MDRRNFMVLGAVSLAATRLAHAQAGFPNRPVTLVSPWAPGGANDLLARLIAKEAAAALGQSVIVENRPGASGVIGTAYVARAKPDGYTLTLGSTPNYTTAPFLYAQLPYDAARDFVPVIGVATVPNVLVVTPSLPVRSVQELVAYAKAHPGTLSYSSVGKGSTQHLAAQLFETMTDTDMIHVPYKGSAPAMQDLLAGRVSLSFENLPPLLPFIRSGALRALAVTSTEEIAQLPGVPTVAASGLPGFSAIVWYAVFAPAGTPPDALKRLHDAIAGLLRKPEVVAQMAGVGALPLGNGAAEMAAYIRADTVKWGGVIRAAGITPE